MSIEIYSEINELRQRLNDLSETGASFERILETSKELDERIVSFHKQL